MEYANKKMQKKSKGEGGSLTDTFLRPFELLMNGKSRETWQPYSLIFK